MSCAVLNSSSADASASVACGPELVRQTCCAFQSSRAWIDHEAVDSFTASLPIDEVIAFNSSDQGLSTNRFGTEVAFQSAQDEAGFITLAHALDFGSGYRYLLHKHNDGKGAWLTIRAGLVRLGEASPSCEAAWLVQITLEAVQDIFQLKHPDLQPLALQLLESIQEVANKLLALGYATPGEFVAANLKGGACSLVSALVDAFPLTFRDEYVLDEQRVCFYKKAQLVVSELFMRFHSELDEYNFADINRLTAFVDNVVVAMMRMNSLVKCPDDLVAMITNGEYLIKGSAEEVALRAASLYAVELVVGKLSNDAINSQKLCNWLWGCLGKKPENRSYPRHLAPSTSFY